MYVLFYTNITFPIYKQQNMHKKRMQIFYQD